MKGKFLIQICLLLLTITSAGQSLQDDFHPIALGEKLPDIFWKNRYLVSEDGKTSEKSLESYRGRLLILDFWATWCSTCLKKMPMLDSIQKKNPQLLSIVLVNAFNSGDSIEKMKVTLSKIKNTKAVNLPYFPADKAMYKMFPTRLLPHYVWIDVQGMVMAITGYNFMTVENIDLMLEKTSQYNLKRKASTSNN